jgi:hypothetical protein
MDYNNYGDIKLGELNEEEVYYVLDYIKIKYNDGYQLSLKKIKHEEDETKYTYYLSVPIRIGALYDNEDPMIYVHREVTTIPFYFIDLYVPESIQCVIYKNKFISNEEVEGCLFDPDLLVPMGLYEIFPFSIYNVTASEENQIRYVKQIVGFSDVST